MEEGDDALGFEREIYSLGEQAEIWLDSVDSTIPEPVYADRVTHYIAALEDIERGETRSAAPSGQDQDSSRRPDRLRPRPNGFGEQPVLKLVFGALIRAERWRGLRFTEFELRQTAAVGGLGKP